MDPNHNSDEIGLSTAHPSRAESARTLITFRRSPRATVQSESRSATPHYAVGIDHISQPRSDSRRGRFVSRSLRAAEGILRQRYHLDLRMAGGPAFLKVSVTDESVARRRCRE